MRIIDMTCAKCGATMKPDLDNERAICEYCGHQVLIEQEDTLEEIRDKAQAEAYGYHRGRLRAEAEAEVFRRKKKSRKGQKAIISMSIFVAIAVVVFISFCITEVSKPQVNPFDCIEVSFQGNDGDGEVVLEVKNVTEGIDANRIEFDISKEDYLVQGETISIRASSEDYRLTEKNRTYIVEGLDEYLKDLENISQEVLEIIHIKAESVLELNLESSRNVGVLLDIKPVKLFLVTDGKQTNRLYDVFEAHFSTYTGEQTYYVMAYFDDVIVRNGEQISIDMSYGMYGGHLTGVEGALYIMAYDSIEEIRADILTTQDSMMELKELDL